VFPFSVCRDLASVLHGRASAGQGPRCAQAPFIPMENIMRWRVMMVLTSAAIAGGLLATDAQARRAGGHGGGGRAAHTGGFAKVRVGGSGGPQVGGIRGSYIAGIPRGAIGYAARTGYGKGIRYGTGILRGRYSGLAASGLSQPAVSADAYVPPTELGSPQNLPIGSPSLGTISGPGLTTIDDDGVISKVSTKTVGMAPASSASAPSNTQNQAPPAFRTGNLVRLRSGGPLMTVKDIKGDHVDCFWTDWNGQINADSFPADVLQME
jgi:uncharacterized protein YodC (DUF2158 family)